MIMGYNPKKGEANGSASDSTNNSDLSLRMGMETGENRVRNLESDGGVKI